MEGKALLNVEDVIATQELARRPARPADHARESRMLGALAAELAERPENLLQQMCDLVVENDPHLSAGVSLAEGTGDARRFRWAALAGAWGHLRGGTMPPDASPCGVVVARDELMLFERPERAFAAARVEPLIREILLVPFHAEGRPVGTLWVNAHDPERRFDREDARLLQSVARFASAGFQLERRVADRTAALRANEGRLLALVQASSQVLYRMSADLGDLLELSGGDFIADTKSSSRAWMLDYIPADDQAMVNAALDEAIGTRRPLALEHQVRRVDGSIGWASTKAVPIIGHDGEIVEWSGAASDITDRKHAEAALRASEERQAFLLRLSDALRPLGDPIEVQATACRLLGERLSASRAYYAENEGRGEAPEIAVIHRDYTNGVASVAGRHQWSDFVTAHRQHLVAGRTLRIDDTQADHAFTDGQRAASLAIGMWAVLCVPLVKNGAHVATFTVARSEPWAWSDAEVALVEDVAERTWAAVERARAEAARADSEERLRAIVETASDYAILTTDLEGRIETWSKGAEGVFGWSAEEIVGEMMDLAFTPEDRAKGAPEWERRTAREEGQAPDVRWHLRKDGSLVFIDGATRPLAGPDGSPRGFVKVGQDITKRRAIEERLRASEALFRQFGEASTDVIWIRDAPRLQFEYVSPAFEAIYGETFARLFAGNDLRAWAKTILPEDRSSALDAFRRVRQGERVNHEFRIRRPSDGAVRWIRDTDFPIWDAEGRVARVAGIGQDVTELKRVEAAVAASELRLRSLTEGIPQLVWRSVDHGEWSWASLQWTAFTGQAEKASHGWGWLDALHPDDRQAARDAWEQSKATDRYEAEYRLLEAATGAYRWFQSRATQVRDEAGALVEWLGTATDVQVLKELQARQGVMVDELQHRTRNLITVVRSIARQTMTNTTSIEAFRESFDSRLEALARVQGLLSRAEQEPITLHALLTLELKALGVAEGERVALDGPSVRLRPTIVQTLALALHELATNARKYGALSEGGGRLGVRWHLRTGDGGRRVHIEWREDDLSRAADAAQPSSGRQGGYGRRLIERALPYALDAQTTYELGPTELRCTIDLPLDRPPDSTPNSTGST